MKVGVIVGRFQVAHLHQGHREYIYKVFSQFDKVLIVLGCSPLKDSERNPLNLKTRQLMLLDYIKMEDYADKLIDIVPHYDTRSDIVWSMKLDDTVRSATKHLTDDVTLTGGKDNYFPYYSGDIKTLFIETSPEAQLLDGTHFRHEVARTELATEDFRRGIIYQNFNQYPKVYPTVDIIIRKFFDVDEPMILLGRKPNEDQYRFPGGFVDPTDESYEVAALREAKEECGNTIELDDLTYVGSYQVNDWRYSREPNRKIITTLFQAEFVGGEIVASDDLEEVKWFKINEITEENMVSEHYRLLYEHYSDFMIGGKWEKF